MHRNRTWQVSIQELRTQRNRILPIEGGDGSTLSLDFTTGVLDPRLTFTRNGGGTYTGNDGLVYGMDFATSSSLAIGTGAKSVTLTATAGVDRRYLVGQTVWISNGANNMRGPVTAYNASTQVLTIDATGTSGSGSFTSWTVGNASARFDYDPTAIGNPRGLLIEASASNLVTNSVAMWNWGTSGPTRTQDTAIADIFGLTGASNITTKVVKASGGGNQYTTLSFAIPQITVPANTSVDVTLSMWIRMDGANQPKCSLGILDTGGVFGAVFGTQSPGGQSVSNSSVTMSSYSSAECDYTFGSVTGWVRCSISRRLNNTTASPINWTTGLVLIYPDRFTANSATIYVCGGQVELGIGPSSWIPTGASTGSRAYDHCYATGANFNSWFSVGAGTMVAVSDNIKSNSQNLAAMISDDSASNYIRMGFKVGGAANEYLLTTVGLPPPYQGAADSGYAPPLNTVYRMAYAWDTNNFGIVANGGAVVTDSSGTVAGAGVLTRLVVGGDFVAAPNDVYFKNGHIRSLKYWPTRLPNAQLQALTT